MDLASLMGLVAGLRQEKLDSCCYFKAKITLGLPISAPSIIVILMERHSFLRGEMSVK